MASACQVFLLLCLSSRLFISRTVSAADQAEQEGPECPPGWTRFGSRCYIFFHKSRNWIDGEESCISAGGNLASVHNDEQHAFLRALIERSAGHPVLTWIGGADGAAEGRWLWSDGTRFEYTRWGNNEPNNAGIENCAEMNWGNYWNDRRCTNLRPFVCARNI